MNYFGVDIMNFGLRFFKYHTFLFYLQYYPLVNAIIYIIFYSIIIIDYTEIYYIIKYIGVTRKNILYLIIYDPVSSK